MDGTAVDANESPDQHATGEAGEGTVVGERPRAGERPGAGHPRADDQPGGLDVVGAWAWVEAFHRRFSADAAELGELDRRAGDGDFGNNILAALRRVRARLEQTQPTTPGAVFLGVSHGFLNTGGTSGPLFGLWFRGIGRATDGPVLTLAQLAAGVDAGTATVQRLGKARPGDKTMVDAMVPAVGALAAAVADGLDLADGVALAAEAARGGALATEALRARRGRASYVGDVARGVLDPGALTVALFFDSCHG
ncbi:dihydroxyacetone kinase subunit DhaL [Pseudofrankia inefficax]|uniref:Dihydroxyacetone kinase, L subunit n=1 Tax=Pseudofrankia inefficax (strain DSM 45817 / CECT 9037 / DDB 130130 / EuI1c) TaxID=298654 RepID=E3J2C4_PSEI1|nr:dihydroxyacetone kinase subunit DhaL [Pseudofrankia inefficax]ADP79296.1 dihydroxyacetone kinase, L subunit [Pseudofrankia inefficax]